MYAGDEFYDDDVTSGPVDSDLECAATASAPTNHWQVAETFGHVCRRPSNHADGHLCDCGYEWARI